MLRRGYFSYRLPIRLFSEKSAAKTEVVLLHFGQPWTEFYAKQFLQNKAALFYGLPPLLHRFILKEALLNTKIRGCIESYGDVPSLEVQVDKIAKRLESSLSTIVPEFGPFRVSRLFFFDKKSIEDNFGSIKKNRSKHLIFVPLYPHFHCADSGNLLTIIAEQIEKSTIPSIENNQEVLKSRVEQNSDYSFDISTVHRWSDHPVLSEYWASKLQPNISKFKGIVFAVPRKFSYSRIDYDRSVWSSSERVMTRLAHSVPWRLAFYNSWDSWDLPCRYSVERQVKQFETQLESDKIAIVPITEMFETFDTLHVLPKLVEKINNAVLIKPERESETIIQGLSEILKNHLLGRPHKQLEASFDHSFRKNKSLPMFF